MTDTLLIIEDEKLLGNELKRYFSRRGWRVELAADADSARRALGSLQPPPLVVLSDMQLPDGNGLDLLAESRERQRRCGPADADWSQVEGGQAEWVFLTAYGSVPDSVRALQLGACDYLEKPCDRERLEVVVSSAARAARAHRRLSEQDADGRRRFSAEAFLGRSDAAAEVRDMLRRLAAVPFSSLLITGETGTGKGLAARILHHCGARAGEPLVEVNCSALPPELLESELFGHEAGAFTGARGRRRGLFEQASGGTLFLDEIGDMSVDLQSKLLTAIEDGQIRRLGGERTIDVDVQLVAATNQDVGRRIAAGRFREDLFHRLSAFQVALPPLRSRRQDLRDLVPAMVAEFNASAGRRVQHIDQAVWRAMEAHTWPGNIRELRNVVERCVLFADDEHFPARWLQLVDAGSSSAAAAVREGDRLVLPLDGSVALEDMERFIISAALQRTGHNVAAAARLLGTSRETLRYRVQKYGLRPPADGV